MAVRAAEPVAAPTAVAPLARAAFAALDESGAAWCLLRGEDELAAPADLDVLVARSDERRAADALRAHGFARLPAWGRGPHRQFVAYDAGAAAWLKVDLVVALAFGRAGELTSDAAAGVLARRRRVEDRWAPADDDAFWTLLVHCLLDDGRIARAHAATLGRLAWHASGHSRLAAAVERACPDGWTTGAIVAAAATGGFDELERLAEPLRAGWPWRRPAPARAGAALLRRATPFRRPGLAVGLLGPDGAGKSTLAPALAAGLPVPARTAYAGLYPAGAPRMRRRGLRLAHTLLRLRGVALTARWHRLRGRIVVFDRHPCEALARPSAPLGRRSRIRRALLARACPRPDLVLLLDAPGELLYLRKHEHDPVRLDEQRLRLAELATRLPDAVRLDTTRAAAEVRADALGIVWERYARRLDPGCQQ